MTVFHTGGISFTSVDSSGEVSKVDYAKMTSQVQVESGDHLKVVYKIFSDRL